MKKIIDLFKKTISEYNDDGAMRLGASLAYYTVFSIGPIVLLVVSIAGLFVEENVVTTTMYEQMKDLVGESAAQFILTISENMRVEQSAGIFTIIGVIVLIFGATGVFIEIQNSINYIFSIKAKPKKGWFKFLTNRVISFSLILGIGFVMIAALMINTITDLMVNKLVQYFPETDVFIFQTVNIIVLFIIITLLFAIIYKVLPDAIISWKDSFVGASFTAILFIIGKFLIGYYLGNSKMGVTYGAAASIIILLSWVYYSAAILYFGAEFTKVYAIEIGSGIKVNSNAVFIEKREVKELQLTTEVGTTEDNKEVPRS